MRTKTSRGGISPQSGLDRNSLRGDGGTPEEEPGLSMEGCGANQPALCRSEEAHSRKLGVYSSTWGGGGRICILTVFVTCEWDQRGACFLV